MKKTLLMLIIAALLLVAVGTSPLTALAADQDYAIISNSAFEAEQGNLFSTVFFVESDNAIEALEFHLGLVEGCVK